MTIEGEPVVSYKGDVDGFAATADEFDEKIDVERYCCYPSSIFCGLFCHHPVMCPHVICLKNVWWCQY